MVKTLDKDEDKRQGEAISCRVNLCLKAGAGSGKTTTLVEHVLGYVAENPSERSIAKILAITFTEKAATEIRERIGSALWKRYKEAVTAKDRAGQKLWDREIRTFCQAFIGTIHGYAMGLIKDYSFYLKLPQDVTVDDSWAWADLSDYLIDALADKEPNVLKALDYIPLNSYGRQFSLSSALSVILTRLSGWGLSGLSLLKTEKPPLSALIKDYKDQRAALAVAYANNKKLAKYEEAFSYFLTDDDDDLIKEANRFEKSDYDRHAGLLKLTSLFTPKLRLLGKSQAKIIPPERDACVNAANLITVYLQDILCAEVLKPLVALSAKVLPEVRLRRLARGSIDYDDILSLARDLLRDRAVVRNREREKWDLVLVDEFQDTNRLQTDLLAPILDQEERGLNWGELNWAFLPSKLRVFGDSNQSIYRFRGAESRIMDDLAETLKNHGRTINLEINYRSQPELVYFFNTFFRQNLTTYTDQTPNRDSCYPDPKVAWLTENFSGNLNHKPWKVRQSKILVMYLAKLFSGEAGVRVQTKEKKGQPPEEPRLPLPGDIGLLFRSRTHIGLFERAIIEAGYPCHIVKGLSFSDLPEIMGLTSFYCSLMDYAVDYYLYGFLTSSFGPVSHKTLEALVWANDKPVALSSYFTSASLKWPKGINQKDLIVLDEIRELYLALKPLVYRRPTGEILETALEARYLLPLVAGTGGDGLEKVRVIQQFLGFAKSLPYHDPRLAQSPVDQLLALWANESAKENEPVAENETVGNAINILTIHQAKGLEFPVTIIPEADRYDHHPVDLLIDDEGHLALSFRDARGVRLENWEFQAIKDSLERKDYLERRRLFYVAATRARDHLVLLGKTPSPDSKAFLTPIATDLATEKPKLAKLVKVLNEWPETVPEAAESVALESKSLSEPSPKPASVDLSANLIQPPSPKPYRYSSVVKFAENEDNWPNLVSPEDILSEERDYAEIEGKVGPIGPTEARVKGVLFHALLEETDYAWDLEKYINRLHFLAKRESATLTKEEAEYIAGRAMAFQDSPLGRDAAAAFNAGRYFFREENFWLKVVAPAKNGPKGSEEVTYILNGVIDLFFLREDGRGQVVDYKLAKNKGVKAYNRQLEIYKLALRKAGFSNEVLGELWYAES
ncbi:MAG: UvrD-helicase domain-containing protein [Deltaproteobacteria bacterium]|nr:UvrD-helicase domain-containing protein [Deltaproteobacteria bacterium]